MFCPRAISALSEGGVPDTLFSAQGRRSFFPLSMDQGCPILAAPLFLRLGWVAVPLNNSVILSEVAAATESKDLHLFPAKAHRARKLGGIPRPQPPIPNAARKVGAPRPDFRTWDTPAPTFPFPTQHEKWVPHPSFAWVGKHEHQLTIFDSARTGVPPSRQHSKLNKMSAPEIMPKFLRQFCA